MDENALKDQKLGERLWSAFLRLRNVPSDWWHSFGTLPVTTTLYAGDGGTFACHVKERVKKGTWSLHVFGLEDEDIGIVLACRDGSDPVHWEYSGQIRIDSSVGAFVPAASLKEINAQEDSEELTDAIDEALFGSDDDEAVLETPEGRHFAVFQLGGDGNYTVLKGIDSDGAVIALAVICY